MPLSSMFTLRESGSTAEKRSMYKSLVDEESVQDEKESRLYTALEEDNRHLQQRLRHLTIWTYSLAALFACCFVTLLLSIGSLPASSQVSDKQPVYVNGEPMLHDGSGHHRKLTPVPKIPLKNVVWDRVEVFANSSDPLSKDAWAAYMPLGDGLLVVDHPEEYALGPGKKTDQGEVYDVTMFHQLHCLSTIRAYTMAMVGFAQDGVPDDDARTFVGTRNEHVDHCFDYIRQGLMCSADMTIEPPHEAKPDASFATDGWGIEHQCKSWDAIVHYVGQHRYRQAWEVAPVTPHDHDGDAA